MTMRRSQPQISIIIPTHARPHQLARLLDSLLSQDLDRTHFEVLVVTNLADLAVERVVEMIKHRGLPAVCLTSGTQGVNRARNRGLEAARGELLYFLDDDCRLVYPDHLTQLVSRFTSQPDIAVRGGFYSNTQSATSFARGYNAVANAWLQGRSGGPMLGGNFCVRREVLGASDIFEESIVYGGSEVGFQQQLIERGLKFVLDRDLSVEHDCSGDARTLISKAWTQGRHKKRHRAPGSLRSAFRSGAYLYCEQSGALENFRRFGIGTLYGAIAQLGAIASSMVFTRSPLREISPILDRN